MTSLKTQVISKKYPLLEDVKIVPAEALPMKTVHQIMLMRHNPLEFLKVAYSTALASSSFSEMIYIKAHTTNIPS